LRKFNQDGWAAEDRGGLKKPFSAEKGFFDLARARGNLERKPQTAAAR